MGLAVLVGLGVVAKPVAAITTDTQSASILVFPKVIADGTRDTIIQISNTSNSMRYAHCFYATTASSCVGGISSGAPCSSNHDCSGGLCQVALVNPNLPPGPTNPVICSEKDFDIRLTKQQPTHWVVSTGRLDYPLDKACKGGTTPVVCNPATTGGPSGPGAPAADCCDAGFDPGHVPPVVTPFKGELKCIEVTSAGDAESGNALKGEATIEEVLPQTADVSKYNAIGVLGNDSNNGDTMLCLGGGVTGSCPSGAEYDACPLSWILDHPAVGAPDPVVGATFCGDGITNGGETCSSVDTNLTVVPCSEDFLNQTTPAITLQFQIINEFEQAFSASTTFSCWASFNLEDINAVAFKAGALGAQIAETRMRSAAGTPFGVMAVLEETHTDKLHSLTARSAQNAHSSFQEQPNGDVITFPADQGGQQTPGG